MGNDVLDDVRVGLQFLEDGDLAHGGGRHSLILIFEFDFLDCDEVLEDAVAGLEDDPISAFSEAFALLVALLDLNVHLSNAIIMKSVVNSSISVSATKSN